MKINYNVTVEFYAVKEVCKNEQNNRSVLRKNRRRNFGPFSRGFTCRKTEAQTPFRRPIRRLSCQKLDTQFWIVPNITRTRTDSQVMLNEVVGIGELDRYIHRKRDGDIPNLRRFMLSLPPLCKCCLPNA